MSLKAALQADLAAKGLNLGDLADELGITQQSVSKWIAKDEIPKDRVIQVVHFLRPSQHTQDYIQAQSRARFAEVRYSPRTPPQPGDEDEEVSHISFMRPHQEHAVAELARPAQLLGNRRPLDQRRVEKWAALLNAPERKNVLRAVEMHGAFRRFDYLSDKLAIIVRSVPDVDPTRLIHSSVPLLLMKAQSPALDCKLVLLPPEEMNLPAPLVERNGPSLRAHLSRSDIVKRDLFALGINVIEFSSAAMLAAMIDSIENPESGGGPVFSYEDYPDDAYAPAGDDTQ